MPVKKKSTLLIIEPNKKLKYPYAYLEKSNNIVRVDTIDKALRHLENIKPDLITVSASFSPSNILVILETAVTFPSALIPLLVVVDLSNRINYIPGTSWGKKIAVIDSCASQDELNLSLARISNS